MSAWASRIRVCATLVAAMFALSGSALFASSVATAAPCPAGVYDYDQSAPNTGITPTRVSHAAGRTGTQVSHPARRSLSARFADLFAAEEAAPLFGQTTASAVFRNGTFAGRTIGDVAAALRAGDATAADLPVDVIVRNGETIGLNTRSMLALRRAGIPVNDWVINDVTGNPAMERLLTERLARNGINGGTGLLRITGAGPNASSLR